jgi:acyl-CoA synthetase (AMP-forming)/AMP-acid ligase II
MITNRIYEWAHSQPRKTAFINDGKIYDYAAFARAIEAARNFFERQELPLGKTAIILAESPGSAWILVMALRALGLDTIMVQSLAQADDLKLRNVACIVVSQNRQEALRLHGDLKMGAKLIVVPTAIFSTIFTGDLPVVAGYAPPFGGHILFTSGTTGGYKKLLLIGEHESGRNAARAQSYSLSIDTFYHASHFGLWTTVGFRMPSAVWHVGGSVVFETRHQPFTRFFSHPINFSILTPPMLKELIESTGNLQRNNSFELSITAGFLPSSLAETAIRHITEKVGIGFGSSELSTPVLLSRFTESSYWLASVADRIVQIVDENGYECRTNQEGELRVLLKDIDCNSYMDDPEASATVFRNGFFYPGDMAVRRGDGRVRILGRTVDVLNVQGAKVAVAPIELALQQMLGVDEVCLFSGLDEAGKDQLAVAIQADKELPRSALDAVTRKFPTFERVRFTVLKQFPRTETGTQKTQRAVLRKVVFPES